MAPRQVQPSFIFSTYQLGLTYNIDGTTLLAPGQAKANRVATRAQVAGAEAELVFAVGAAQNADP